jgi:hypothetical protein
MHAFKQLDSHLWCLEPHTKVHERVAQDCIDSSRYENRWCLFILRLDEFEFLMFLQLIAEVQRQGGQHFLKLFESVDTTQSLTSLTLGDGFQSSK